MERRTRRRRRKQEKKKMNKKKKSKKKKRKKVKGSKTNTARVHQMDEPIDGPTDTTSCRDA